VIGRPVRASRRPPLQTRLATGAPTEVWIVMVEAGQAGAAAGAAPPVAEPVESSSKGED
jgi:hypothetical protein